MIASEHGTSSAAPTPCTARATIELRDVGARPHHSEAAAKIADAEDEDAAPAEAVAGRAADQQQRGEAKRVGVDQPLHDGERGAQIGLDAPAARR